MLRIFHNTSYDFNRWWKPAAIGSGLFIIIGLVVIALKGLSYSVEFTGGTLKQLEFSTPVSTSDIRETLEKAGFEDAEIQQFGSQNEFTVRVAGAEDVAEQEGGAEIISEQVNAALVDRFGEQAITVVRTEAVGPRVGKELRRNALFAVLISFVIVLIYLAVRFEWRFGLAAVVLTVYDILATFAFMGLMQVEISLTIVAAILTVLGYSLNDTIIIFDRVRENIKLGKKGSLYSILNASINETLPRSIMTHSTVMAAVVALLVFAGDVIRPFAWVMGFGIIIAVFSSTFLAGPALMWIEKRYPRSTKAAWSDSSIATATSQTLSSKTT